MEIQLKNTEFVIKINSKGAELVSIQKKETSREYIWDGNPKFWGKHSPVLFPIVGTLKDNCYFYKNQKYKLSRHGFARGLEFEITEQTENRVIFGLKATEETRTKFPFEFELQINYQFVDTKLSIKYKITNRRIHCEAFEAPLTSINDPLCIMKKRSEVISICIFSIKSKK